MKKDSGSELSASWDLCFELLPEVSRTFALAIAGLKHPLRGAVCVSYLLCRVLDTIEDAPGLGAPKRWELMEPLLARLADDGPLGAWPKDTANELAEVSSPSDLRLIGNAGHVLASFRACDPSSRLAMMRWVTEMGKGMVAWSERMGDTPGRTKMLPSLVALDRYCYYIAGTVGYLLTDLFYIHSPLVDQALFYRLQEDAEVFGLGLQKVNIVKDLADDFRRGWCFIPTIDLSIQSLTPADFLDQGKGDPVYRAVLPVLRSAAGHLRRAWRYLTRIPIEEKEIRLFLGYSLFFALGTMALVAEDPCALVRPAKLKISRLEVARIVAACNRKVSDPEGFERLYQKFSAPLAAFETES